MEASVEQPSDSLEERLRQCQAELESNKAQLRGAFKSVEKMAMYLAEAQTALSERDPPGRDPEGRVPNSEIQN